MVDDEGWWVYWGISWVGRFPSNRHHDEAPCQILGGLALVHWCLMPPSMLYNGNQWPIKVQGLHCILQLPVFLSFLDKLQKRRSCRTPCGWKLFKPSLKPISKIDVITNSFFSMSSLGLPTVFFSGHLQGFTTPFISTSDLPFVSAQKFWKWLNWLNSFKKNFHLLNSSEIPQTSNGGTIPILQKKPLP